MNNSRINSLKMNNLNRHRTMTLTMKTLRMRMPTKTRKKRTILKKTSTRMMKTTSLPQHPATLPQIQSVAIRFLLGHSKNLKRTSQMRLRFNKIK
jgi:hypothetical protein